MKNVNYKLEDVVAKIEEVSGSKARLEFKFGLEYLIPHVTDENLMDVGFEFIEYSSYNRCPTYQMGNIFALFDDQVLHVSTTILPPPTGDENA